MVTRRTVNEIVRFALKHHPLNFIERHSVVPAIVEPGGAGGFMPSHLLRHFEFAAVLQIHGDSRRTEAVAGDFCCDCGFRGMKIIIPS